MFTLIIYHESLKTDSVQGSPVRTWTVRSFTKHHGFPQTHDIRGVLGDVGWRLNNKATSATSLAANRSTCSFSSKPPTVITPLCILNTASAKQSSALVVMAVRHRPYRAVPLWYWQSDNRTSTAVLPHLRTTQKGNLARPHSRSPQVLRKPEGPAMYCHFHRGDWSFYLTNDQSSFSFSSRWHRRAWKGPYALRPVSQQSPQGCLRNRAKICLVEHRSFSALEGGMSAASFLHSSFLQVISAAMLWPVHVQKVPQASEHLCPEKLQTRCDICCACQSIFPSIPIWVCTFGCLTSQQHASVSQVRICSEKCTCCLAETEVADQTFHLTQSQYTDIRPTSPSTDPISPDAWQG